MSTAPPSPQSLSTLHTNHSTSLRQRAAALDLRAQQLAQAEANLSARLSTFTSRVIALEKLETSIRRENASLLEALSTRQQDLTKREERHKKKEHALVQRLRAIRQTLRDGADAENLLKERMLELEEMGEKERLAVVAMENAEGRKEEALRVMEDAIKRREEAMREAERVSRAIERLENLERSVQLRDGQVKEQEEKMMEQKRKMERYAALERLFQPLKTFLAEASAITGGTERKDVEQVEEVAEEILIVLKKLEEVARDARRQKIEVEDARVGVARREKEVRKTETLLRGRERAIEAAEVGLKVAGDDLKGVQNKVDEAWRAVEEARMENDAKEEALRLREAECLRKEQKMRHAEMNVQQQERMLLRRERSIRRAHAAISEREQILEQRSREVDEEKANLQNLKVTIELKEDLLDTRDLELRAREAKKDKALDALLEASVEKSNCFRGKLESPTTPENTTKGTSLPSAQARDAEHTVAEDEEVYQVPIPGQPITELSAPMAAQSATQALKPTASTTAQQPGTVRRQLAFDTTVVKGAPRASRKEHTTSTQQQTKTAGLTTTIPVTTAAPDGIQQQVNPLPDNDDDESEAAAEDLLPELVGARALWRERVSRLETVVSNMNESTSSVKPHLQPVLTNISSQLRNIREDIDSSPEQSFESPKMSYAAEQRRQLKWSTQMRDQLDAVRDLQAGMLIALNKEEDAVLSEQQTGLIATEEARDTTRTLTESESSVSHSGGGDQSSADMTVDVTQTEVHTGEILETSAEMDTVNSFEQFRAQLQALQRRGVGGGGLNERGRTNAAAISVRSTPVATRADHGTRVLQSNSSAATTLIATITRRGEPNLLQELATLRNELETITASSNQ